MDFTTILYENFNALIALFSSVLGGSLGFMFSLISQRKSFERQMKWEKEKRRIDKLEELTKIYNSILRIDGENGVIDYNQGRKHEIQEGIYIQHVRPLLYEKFHLLHSDIAELIKEIDYILLKWSVLEEESYDGEIEHVASLYLSIIDKINRYLDSLRLNQN